MNGKKVVVQLLFVDNGSFHQTRITVPAPLLEPHPRLIDAFREDPDLQKKVYLDLGRLAAAWISTAEK